VWEVDADGDTALHVAARLGRAGIVHELLCYGAEYKARNGAGQTPLEVAALAVQERGLSDEYSEIVNILLRLVQGRPQVCLLADSDDEEGEGAGILWSCDRQEASRHRSAL
jgi:hypothetical protein